MTGSVSSERPRSVGRIGVLCLLSALMASTTTTAAAGSTNDGAAKQGRATCYSCTATEADSQCELDPSQIEHGVLRCGGPDDRRSCTTVRVEEWPSRRIKSFYRGCDARTAAFERPHCVVEGGERTCFAACDAELCNAGDGLDAERQFLRYDSVAPPPDVASTASSSSSTLGCRPAVYTVNALLMAFPFWVM